MTDRIALSEYMASSRMIPGSVYLVTVYKGATQGTREVAIRSIDGNVSEDLYFDTVRDMRRDLADRFGSSVQTRAGKDIG